MTHTQGVETLLGDPKKAIIRLSIPMIIAMSAQSIYNLADAIWVSGIPGTGNQALSAVGFYFPFLLLTIALSVGIGIGGGTAISRKIGQGDRQGANSVGIHSIVIMLIVSAIYTLLTLIFQKPLFKVMGAESALDATLSYSTIMFGGSILFFFSHIANSLLRSEGDVQRAMRAMLIGTLLNIILDPIFIYEQIPGISFISGLGLGVAGAAWATILSVFISSLFMFHWLFIEKKTHIQLHFKGFKWHKETLQDIVKVGLPSSLSQATMAIMNIFIVVLITGLTNDDGVAVFTAGWRIVAFAILPMLGMATAVTSVTGAAFGAGNHYNLKVSHAYAVVIGTIIELVVAGLVFIFAPQLVSIFTYSEATRALAPDIVEMLRIMVIFFPSVGLGMMSSSMFEGTGHGFKALIITILRTVSLGLLFAWLFAFPLGMGVNGVYYGMVSGSWLSGIIAFVWARSFIHRLKDSL